MSRTPEEVLKFLKLKSIDDLFADTDSESDNDDKFLVQCAENAETEEKENEELLEYVEIAETVIEMDLDEKAVSIQTERKPLIVYTPDEMRNNFLVAKIRQIDATYNQTMRNKLEDVFWPIRMWPTYILEVLVGVDFKRQDRLVLATFLHGNGMMSNVFAERIFKYYNSHWKNDKLWKRRLFEFCELWKFLEKATDRQDPDSFRIRTQYYFYSMTTGHMMFYDGYLRGNHGNRIAYAATYT